MNVLKCDIIRKGLITAAMHVLMGFSAFAAPNQEMSASHEETTSASEVSAEESSELNVSNYTEEDFMPKTSESSYIWDIVKMIIVLGIMAGGFYYFFKFISKKTGVNARGEGIIQTLAALPVGQNKYVQIVDIAGRILILGVTDGGISLITEITDREQIDRIRIMGSAAEPVPEGGFQAFLRESLSRAAGRIGRSRSGKLVQDDSFSDYSQGGFDYFIKQKNRLKDLDR